MSGEAGETSGLQRWFVIALGVVALGGVGFLIFAGGGGPEPIGPLSQAEISVSADSAAYAAALGPEDAPVTLMEFADYQCSHCARFAALPGPAIKRDYVQEGRVRMLVYDFPLSRQSNAIPAALAARCAGDQDRYWEMHDLLYANQRAWAGDASPEDRFADYAERIGLDQGAFNECYSERRHLSEIFASRAFGRRLGVSGTPSIFVNGHKAGSYAYESVASLIEAELDSAGVTDGGASEGGGGAAGP